MTTDTAKATDTTLPDGVVKVIHHYYPEYPDDPRIKRTIHVMEDGEEKEVFSGNSR